MYRKIDEDIFRKREESVALLEFPVEATDYSIVDLFNCQSAVKDLISQIGLVRMAEMRP